MDSQPAAPKPGLTMKYFVLKPKGKDLYARASRKALRAYANMIRSDNPEFAGDLHNWADFEMELAIDQGMLDDRMDEKL